MRVAIVHYWLVGMRGGEKVVEQLCDLFPQADIFTHAFNPAAISAKIRSHRVTTSFISRLPAPKRMYKTYLPLMPLALESLDLRGYDLIISSESGPAKGIVCDPNALHICYCHSPMRYIWNMYHEYLTTAKGLTRLAMPLLSHYLRLWDVSTSTRVHHFVANSKCVKARIGVYYGRSATVIYPPVATQDFEPVGRKELGDFYLMVGELVSYKRADLAIDAFNVLGLPLVVIGGGEGLSAAMHRAGPTIQVLGPQSFDRLRWFYARCRALIFPGEEDFGMVPVEAMASGRPVIAYRKGGAIESVVDGVTGIFFDEQSSDCIIDAVTRFEDTNFQSDRIVAHARRFSEQRFRNDFVAFVEAKLREHINPRSSRDRPPSAMSQYPDDQNDIDERSRHVRQSADLVHDA